VLGTLVLQGFTIRPLIALLRITPDRSLDIEVAEARSAMLDAALAELAGFSGQTADAVRAEYRAARAASADPSRPATAYDSLRSLAVAAERRLLVEWRQKGRIDDDAYHLLEEELDRAELHAASVGTASVEG
jgi:NhaP-type Na+/H+ or K+/H+ antiporter